MKYATIDKDTKLGDPAFVDTRRFAGSGGSCISAEGMALKLVADGRIVTGSLPLRNRARPAL